MYAAGHAPFGRRRRTHRRRGVSVSALTRRATASESERLAAYRNGLWAVEFLHRHFPAQYEEHVARQPITLPYLVCVAEYFLILANQHLFQMDEGWSDLNLSGDAERALTSTKPLTETEAISLLTEELGTFLLNPFPVFWGLPREWESLFHEFGGTRDHNILLPAVWHIVAPTTWAYAEGDGEDRGYFEEIFSAEGLAALRSLPALQADTNMPRLAAYLDTLALTLVPEVAPVRNLGSIIKYILRLTGNGFADYCYDIIAEDFGGQIGFDFTSSDDELRENREAQREGEQLYRAFADLDDVVQGDPACLRTLAQFILDAAAHLAAHPEPDTLVEILGTPKEPSPAEEPTVVPTDPAPAPRRERPWLKRRAYPAQLPQEDILIGGQRPDAQISVYADGTTLLTRRDGAHGYRCYPVSPKVLSQTLSQVPMSAGPLVPNTLGAGWMEGRAWYCVYIPPQTRTLRTLVREAERAYTFELPPLVWWGWSNQFRIWALPAVPAPGTYPALDTALCVAPFPNCNPGGSICWGTAQTPELRSVNDLLPAFAAFFTSFFNDHLANGKSTAYPANVLLRWDDLAPGQPYPLDDLQPASSSPGPRPMPITLGQIVNAQWRFS